MRVLQVNGPRTAGSDMCTILRGMTASCPHLTVKHNLPADVRQDAVQSPRTTKNRKAEITAKCVKRNRKQLNYAEISITINSLSENTFLYFTKTDKR